MEYETLMAAAIAEAKRAQVDVPVGAVLVSGYGEVVASAHNQKELTGDPSGHAEILALRKAAEAEGNWRLEDLTMVVTLEPCVMCAGAIVAARIKEVVFGAFDEKVGAAGSAYDIVRDSRLGGNVGVVGGVLETECQELLKDFFQSRRG
ncbi:MAG: nucleoside deaminase [Actinobacteria bacterium]|nr:nucleoside deaminase [Actinomycetota bacterium]